jgi:DNA-binding transcriptional MerR regulator
VHEYDALTWLTISELSARLDIPLSTLRSWSDTYAEYIPQRFDERGHQTYPLERLLDVQRVLRGSAERMTSREVRRRLAEGAGAVPERPSDPAIAALLAEILAELRALRAEVDELARRLAGLAGEG